MSRHRDGRCGGSGFLQLQVNCRVHIEMAAVASNIKDEMITDKGGIIRVGQNHICTVYIRYFWQRNHLKYGHTRCIYTVLANPRYNKKKASES